MSPDAVNKDDAVLAVISESLNEGWQWSRYSLNGGVDRAVWLVQERQADGLDGVLADLHFAASQDTSHHLRTRRDIAAFRRRPGTWHEAEFRCVAKAVLGAVECEGGAAAAKCLEL